jgi:SAM-dependent methyltransferase
MANEAKKVLSRVEKMVSKGKVVDLGCGPFKIHPNAIGVDPGGYEGIESQSSLEYLKALPDNSVDVVFSSHYFEHEREIAEVLGHVTRTLKPDGKLIAYLPNRLAYKGADGNDPNGDHVNHWTAGEFADLILAVTPLVILSIENRVDGVPPNHAFTGNGETEHPDTGKWEYSFLVIARKPKPSEVAK